MAEDTAATRDTTPPRAAWVHEPEQVDCSSLGVLFVHGIGEQRRGTTVVTFADPLHRCLERLLTRDDELRRELEWRRKEHKFQRARMKRRERRQTPPVPTDQGQEQASPVPLVDATLRSSSDDPRAPAHLVLRIESPVRSGPAGEPGSRQDTSHRADPTPDQTMWCLAESWWAEEFEVPKSSVLVRWALTVAPAIILSQFAKIFNRRLRSERRSVVFLARLSMGLALLVLSLAISALAVLLLLLLLLFSIVPIPKLSSVARRIATRLATSIGDSFVLVESPAQFSAMVSKVRRDLEWLSSKCENVAIVAHSQGAVVAHYCLRQYRPANLRLLVTLGSGLGKLDEITTLRKRPSQLRSMWGITLHTLFIAGAAAVGYLLRGISIWYAWSMFLILSANSIIWVCVGIRNLVLGQAEDEGRLKRELHLPGVGEKGGYRWIDFFASADPISNGPIFQDQPDWMESRLVWNNASVFTDHSGYVKNSEGFVTMLGCELGKLLAEDDSVGRKLRQQEERLVVAGRRRAWRLRWLVWARWVLAGAAALVLWQGFWGDLLGVGRRMADDAPKDNPLAKLAGSYQDVSDYLDVRAHGVIALALLLLSLLSAIVVVSQTWSLWQKRDIDRFFREEAVDLGGFRGAGFLVAILFVAMLALGAAFPDRLAWAINFYPVGSSLALVVSLSFVFPTLTTDWSGQPQVTLEEWNLKTRRVSTRCLQLVALAIPLTVGLAAFRPGWWRDLPLPLPEALRAFSSMLLALLVVVVALVARRALEPLGSKLADWLIEQSIVCPGEERVAAARPETDGQAVQT